MIRPGATLTLGIEKPAAGGRMLGRHEGQVVLVSNAIPGEQVRARVERASKGMAFAEAVEILTPSPDRRPATDWRCGGNLLAHIAYERQLAIKGEIIRDAFGRIAKAPLAGPPAMIGSPEQGYRMRARLHAADGRFGFYREGTHQLCDPGITGQLLPATLDWLRDVEASVPAASARSIRGLEISEDIPGEHRAAWLDAADDAPWFARWAGPDLIVDRVAVSGAQPMVLQRSARSFFQGNRFLLEQMVARVVDQVADGPVVDLYAGVGLFGLALAARGAEVTLVEGDYSSGRDLEANAAAYPDRARVSRVSVEEFLAALRRESRPTVVVDPPRTGLSKDAIHGILRLAPPVLVYVSCDPATLARDARILIDAGYEHGSVTGFDLFPNTAHVESVVTFTRT
jgi:23S rRNA (uracil1939-C5)-methyltransferase